MTKRTRNTIIIVVVLVVLAILILLLSSRKPKEVAPTPTPTVQTEPAPVQRFAPSPTRPLASAPQTGAEAIARTFAPRYGSFSCESHYENIRDLLVLMTSRMQTRETARIPDSVAGCEDQYGVTSTTLRVETVSQGEATATIDALMQRTESRVLETRTTETSTQTLEMKLIQEGDGWKVDEAIWLDV